MCEYFSIFCHSIMPPPVHCPNLKGVKIMKARISRKFFCLLLTVVMVCTLLPITALAAGSSGSIESVVITHDNGVLKNAVSVELQNVNFESSVQVQLYSDETLLTTATLQKVTPGSYGFLTCCIATETADEYWALTPWTPKDDVVPNKVVLFVDDNKMDTMEFTLNAEDWAVLPGTYGGSIERVGITQAGGNLKNAVSVDLKNVNFKSSVQVKLYSGKTLLTTATLQGVNPSSYGFMTCCIATETADEYWALTPWTPKDDVVPNKVVLFVDDNEMDTMEFTLDAAKWAALPGTVLPCSIERAAITHDNGVLKNAVSVDLKNVNFASSVQVQLYSDETLLTTATLKTGILAVGQNHPFVTCCIPTEGEDAAWSLTSWTPRDNVVPNKAVLVVDGLKLAEKTFTLNADEWAALPGTAFPYSGSIERAGITHANGVLKNAVSVDLKNVNFESSVQVQLYSGDTLLTTATLKGVNPGSHDFLTCCIATETADEYWALTPWTPKDDVVPNKVVLFVDDNEMDTMEFTLDAAEWKALPGTVLPYSGSIGGGVTTYSITVKSSKNGDVTASHKSASKGTTVTLTVDPDKGYVLDTLTVLDGKDKEIKLTEKNGKYTFTMPASKVTVEAMFKAAGNNPFTDVPAGSYYEDAVIWAVEKGITNGVSSNMFAPNDPCTRAQIVTFLWRAAGSPAPKSMSSFTDVPADAFYAKAVAWAVENGITSGTGEGKFSPDATCTRAQAVTFLYRANGSPAVSGNSAFTDVAADAYYAAAVKWAEKNGITGGIGGGLFGSDNDCTRAQIVTFLWRCKK